MLIQQEFPGKSISELMTHLLKLELDHAKRVEYSKSKDDFRGNKVIPGYKDSHVVAKDDAVVKMVWSQAKELQSKVVQILELERKRGNLIPSSI